MLAETNLIRGIFIPLSCIVILHINLVVALFDSATICSYMPGLSKRQRDICMRYPDAMAAIGKGFEISRKECEKQFKFNRWNCKHALNDEVMPQLATRTWQSIFSQTNHLNGSREGAYLAAINAAGTVYAITDACRKGQIRSCGCNNMIPMIQPARVRRTAPGFSDRAWHWDGCKTAFRYGLRISRIFLQSNENKRDASSLVNMHNYRVGRKALKDTVLKQCKCHGVSGSCSLRTCWKSVSDFRHIGNYLTNKYHRARYVRVHRQSNGVTLRLKRPRRSSRRKLNKRPRPGDLIYLRKSPNYCEHRPKLGIEGTRNRECSRNSGGIDSCSLLCCGRGYNTHQIQKTWKCNCKFHWCCEVKCKMCKSQASEYRCK